MWWGIDQSGIYPFMKGYLICILFAWFNPGLSRFANTLLRAVFTNQGVYILPKLLIVNMTDFGNVTIFHLQKYYIVAKMYRHTIIWHARLPVICFLISGKRVYVIVFTQFKNIHRCSKNISFITVLLSMLLSHHRIMWCTSTIRRKGSWYGSITSTWWRHEMETFSVSYWPFVWGIHPWSVNSPQRSVTRSFHVFFD